MNKKELTKYLKLAEMCKSCWFTEDSQAYIDKECLSGKVFHYDKKDLEGFYCEDVENFYIVFRATEYFNIKEWYDNFKLTLLPVNNIRYHKGTVDKFSIYIIEQLKNEVKDANARNKNVIIVGHSLGGSLAKYFGYILHANKIKFDKIYTFGSYMTGGKEFHKVMKDRIINITAKYDFIRCFNWLLYILGYRATYKILDHKGFYSPKYHFMQHYIDLIKDKLKK